MSVTTDQRVTLSGRDSSLKTVIENLCYRAGADLLFYDAEDRPYGGTYKDLPLKEVLRRLLRQESYMIEATRPPNSNEERVVALRVLGPPTVAYARRLRGGAGGEHRFRVPSAVMQSAFDANQDASKRETALAAMASRISSDPKQLQGFLDTEARLIAQALDRYGEVEQPLRQLQSRYPDPRVRAKIDQIIGAVAALRAAKR